MNDNVFRRRRELHHRTGAGFVPPVLVGEPAHDVLDHT